MAVIIHKELNLCNVNLKIYNGPVGITCSGGADSSLLLYFLMKYSIDKIYIFTIGNKEKEFKNITVTNNVIQKCIELTKNINIEHYSVFYDTQTLENILEKPNYYIEKKLINILYTGVTANPPKHITDTFISKVSQRQLRSREELAIRDPLKKRNLLHATNTIYTPWYNIDKYKIAEIYKKYTLLDNLFNYTRSCEWEPGKIDISNPGLDHCGVCWWCQEREWGFS
jgi:7-cyano-7-deazaguanine synthase in queuosine biosynthesis